MMSKTRSKRCASCNHLISVLTKDERALQWIKRKGNVGVRPRCLVGARIAADMTEAKGILHRLSAAGGFWLRRHRQRAERFYCM